MQKFVVEVDLALVRPPTCQKRARYAILSCCAHHAELDGISAATQQYRAEMPVGSRILDWEED